MALGITPAYNSSGALLSGLSPTWSVYVTATSGAAATPPAITELGASAIYSWLASDSATGIIDLGASAVPRYVAWIPTNAIQVFAAFNGSGAPLAALVPVWASYLNADTAVAATGPTFTELSGGLYKFTSPSTGHYVGAISLGTTALPGTLVYDSAFGVAPSETTPTISVSTPPAAEAIASTAPARVRDILVDELTGNWTLTDGDLSLIGDLPSVAQDIRQRLRFFAGEWFLDDDAGVPYYQVVLVKNPNLSTVREVAREAIAGAKGVVSVDSLVLNLTPGRALTINFTATSDLGQLSNTVTVTS